ncbi:MAG TPA: hypothetical protein VF984_07765 [Actinomycetota bacterium]
MGGVGSVNRYHVEVERGPEGWRVTILDPGGRPVAARACRDETEAWTYASTVRQHAYWLSEGKFREYYRLAVPDDQEG